MPSKLRWMLILLALTTLGSPIKPGMTQSSEAERVLLQETGRLEIGDTMLKDGSLVDIYEVSGQAGQTISITLESIEFDSYLLFQTPVGETLDKNNNIDRHNQHSYLSVTLPETGTYRILANAYETWQQGRYRLIVLDGEQAPFLSNMAMEQTEANQLNSLGIRPRASGAVSRSHFHFSKCAGDISAH